MPFSEQRTPDPTQCELEPIVVAVDVLSVFLLSCLVVSIPYILKTRHHRKLRKLIPWWNSFGAGVFLGTLFFHLIPETREKFTTGSTSHSGELDLSFESVLVSGFLFILLFEQIFTDFCFEIPGLSHAHGHGHEVDTKLITSDNQPNITPPCKNSPYKQESASLTLTVDSSNGKPAIVVTDESNVETLTVPNLERTPSRVSDHTAVNHHSAIRALTLVLSISFHAFFEGMALVLQAKSWKENIGILTSIFMHKSAIGLTMSFSVISSNLSPLTAKLCLLLWASISSIGGIIAYCTCANKMDHEIMNMLSAFSIGVFLYVLFFEIAVHEFLGLHHKKGVKVMKAILMSVGTLMMFFMQKSFGHSHDGHDDHSGHLHDH